MNCVSGVHVPPVPATKSGTYGHPDFCLKSDVWFCNECAELAERYGLFTRDDRK